MAIIVHGPGVHDPYPLERLTQEGGPAATQPTAAIRPVQEEAGAASQAAARLRAAIRATRERAGEATRALRAGELMQDGTYILMASMPLGEAREALHRWGIEQAMVVDESGGLIGLLEIGGVLRAVWPPGESPRARVEPLTVGEVCRTPVDAVREDAPLELVARLMLDHDYPALPVVDGENRPVGLIRVADLLRVVLGTVRLEVWA
ncbi:CBS domain-containing protein [Thiofaba sp. EF100]|uniref:CBS domain-containing protein n=1 Tax=Thiofaba sp. EF100 TaxID=3121274 RepID=UPI0032221478